MEIASTSWQEDLVFPVHASLIRMSRSQRMRVESCWFRFAGFRGHESASGPSPYLLIEHGLAEKVVSAAAENSGSSTAGKC
jgi:hypothetical protein